MDYKNTPYHKLADDLESLHSHSDVIVEVVKRLRMMPDIIEDQSVANWKLKCDDLADDNKKLIDENSQLRSALKTATTKLRGHENAADFIRKLLRHATSDYVAIEDGTIYHVINESIKELDENYIPF